MKSFFIKDNFTDKRKDILVVTKYKKTYCRKHVKGFGRPQDEAEIRKNNVYSQLDLQKVFV